ncbi:hypothetical protein BDD12DRAFT_487215 [Trichophaea hybrida]|nr:hypothetical protein BDD12DRAFT_487215 [Trichophaea hybrida]
MGDDNTNQKKRKTKWITSYSNITAEQAEERLGFRFRTLRGIAVEGMLADGRYGVEGLEVDAINKTKEKVYGRILEYLRVEGYPTEADPSFKEVNINDLVYAIISPILDDFICSTGRNNVQLLREKEVVSTDGQTGSTEEFVVVDLISVKEEKFILIVEAKRSSLEQAMKQCLLAMKDMRNSNGEGKVYGFVTTGEQWQMLEYDEKEKWMKGYSVLVDCMYTALSKGGIN